MFRTRRLFGINEYREFYSASVQFANKVLQFRNDGNQVNARRNATGPKTCPEYTGLVIVKSQLDNIDTVEQLIKKHAAISVK